MNRFFIYAGMAFCLITGLFVENHIDLIPDPDTSVRVLSEPHKWRDEFEMVQIKSPLDGEIQPAYFYKTKSIQPQPLIVSLHTWSNDYTQHDSINEFSIEKDINYIHPNFRGVNNHKDACCSEKAISDIDASITYAIQNARVDTSQIFVIGKSGGGYATLAMFMKSKHKIKKFSSWVPLTDLIQWYNETKMRRLKYANEILLCTSSQNGMLNMQVAKDKSPIDWETPIEKLPYASLDIYTGVFDAIIPITHSIYFYNKVMSDLQVPDSTKYITQGEKGALMEFVQPLGNYGNIDGRKIMLMKEANNVSITLFQGGHEMLERYAFDQLLMFAFRLNENCG